MLGLQHKRYSHMRNLFQNTFNYLKIDIMHLLNLDNIYSQNSHLNVKTYGGKKSNFC